MIRFGVGICEGYISAMFKSKVILRVTSFLGLVLSLVGCNSIRLVTTTPINNVYCDNFLIYEMCAEDLDNDGIVEHVYFADTFEVFLYRELSLIHI